MKLCPCGSPDGPTWDHAPDCARYPGSEAQRDRMWNALHARASDPIVRARVAGSLGGLLDRRVADEQAARVITAVLDALAVPGGETS